MSLMIQRERVCKMVWAIAIICISLSCERIPVVTGWYYCAEDCMAAADAIVGAWSPSIGFYEVECVARLVV